MADPDLELKGGGGGFDQVLNWVVRYPHFGQGKRNKKKEKGLN